MSPVLRLPAAALRRCWPSTLFGRMVVILVGGMLMAQLLTSSIWYDMRYGQLLEVPTRIVATRLADTLRLVESIPHEGRDAVLQTLSSSNFRLAWLDSPDERDMAASVARADAEHLLNAVVAARLGQPVPLRLLDVTLLGDDARPAGTWSLLAATAPVGRYRIQARLADGQWFQLDALEGQGGHDPRPLAALADYLVRIYLLRIAVVVAISLWTVRLVMRPLDRLAHAAEALGRDIHSPPLPVDGPQEVRKAAHAFNLMQRSLIEGMAERTRFLAAVSHDLRAPITRLRLRTELLADMRLRDRFRSDLAEMESMVNATLDFVRGIDAQDQRQDIDLDALVGSLVQDLQEGGAAVTVTGRATRPLHGFPQSLRRCLQNLVENALRYGGRADISIEECPGWVRVVVRDGGPGIPDELMDQVFEPFYRVEHSRSAATGGFGLGLSIAKMVATAHRGHIHLANLPGGGLEATLALPAADD